MILERLFERRKLWPGDSAQWERWFGNWAPDVAAGVDVDESTALTFTAVKAAVQILSESLASLPLIVYQRLDPRGKRRDPNHPLYRLLHDRPNRDMTSFRLRETMMGHILTWGNSYAQIVRKTNTGYPVELWPLSPERMEPKRNEQGVLEYHYNHTTRGIVVVPKEQIFHVAGLGYDGVKGYSPITLARETVGLGLAAERFGAGYFGRGARGSGILEFPGEVPEELHKNTREGFERMHSGVDNAHKTVILEQGMTWKPISIPNDDAQFLETRRFQVEEVARMFNMPVHLLREMTNSSVRANIEQESLDYVIYSLRPWLVRWEQEIQRQLFLETDRDSFAEFQVAGLLRGDTETRHEAYAKAKQNGYFSTNDIRELENLNPTGPDGDVYTVQINMQNAAALTTVQPPEPVQTNSARLDLRPLLTDVLERLQRKEQKALARARKRFDGKQDEFDEWFGKFCDEHGEIVEGSMRPIVQVCRDNNYGRFAGAEFSEQYVQAFRTRYVLSLRKAVAEKEDMQGNGNGKLLTNELARLASVMVGEITHAQSK